MLPNNLFLTSAPSDKESFINIITKSAAVIAESYTNEKAYSGLTPDQLKDLVSGHTLLPEDGIGFDGILKKLKEIILPNMLKVTSTDYMAHLHSPPFMESLVSELVLACGNQSMDSWDQAPIATEIELDVIKQLCSLYNLEDTADGIFTSGGTQSNLMGLTLARDWFCNEILDHDVKKYGLPSDYYRIRIYTSEISHFSVEKSAHILGLGYDSVRKVPVNTEQKMSMKSLKEMIKEDLDEGLLPMAIVATAGTTDYGSIDDLRAISKISQKHNMWTHVDAAYGSGLILSEDYANRITGIELCDSMTVDFHKMFLLPISCGAFFLKDGANFSHLTLHADYLNREEDEEDGYTNLVGKSMQTTRRFDALKVWSLFQSLGKKTLSSIINKSVENAEYIYTILKSRSDYQVVTKPEISSVVFRYFNEDLDDNKLDEINKAVRRELIHTDGIVIGQTIFDKNVYLKLTLLNPLISSDNLDRLLKLITEKCGNLI